MLMKKKAVVGIGMLLIFIATILVSSIAAGVLIRSTGLLQERAYEVASASQERLVTGIEVFSVLGRGNVSNESITGFEILVRTRAGSSPIQLENMGISFVSESASFGLDFNSSFMSNCGYSVVTAQEDYCADPRLGNNDTILDEGEMIVMYFTLNSSAYVETEDLFEISIQPKGGSVEVLQLRAPQLILRNQIRLR